MTEKWITTKADLLPQIEEGWKALHEVFNILTDYQLTQIKNPDGWAIKDHVAHLTAWENSVVVMLMGIPRHEGLGISQALYDSDDLDAINKAIFEAHKDEPLHVVFPQFQKTHDKLLSLIANLTDADLMKGYGQFLPTDTGGHLAVINVIYGNTAHHFKEHLGWIEAMLAKHLNNPS